MARKPTIQELEDILDEEEDTPSKSSLTEKCEQLAAATQRNVVTGNPSRCARI